MDNADARVELGGPVGAAPGRLAVVRLRVRNEATGARSFVVSVAGLDSEWLPGVLRTPVLAPGAEAELDLPLTPSAGTPPGTYSFVVLVQPTDPTTGRAAGQVSQVESALVVGDPAQLGIAIEPPDPNAA